ncbi:MAG: hypothetical protein V7K14_14125 [Nostoc sp.]|uniref:hypothetical protein n=1 Tax=Nostoc sp. TaxID=1180 RepID=UPI002FF663A3
MSKEMNQRHLKSQIEIADLIAEAVDHASARRNQVLDTQESLSELSDEEKKGINGGLRIILGYFPITIA